MIAALNASLVTGDGDSASACYHDTDDSSDGCPPGTLYNDIQLSTSKYELFSLKDSSLRALHGRELMVLCVYVRSGGVARHLPHDYWRLGGLPRGRADFRGADCVTVALS